MAIFWMLPYFEINFLPLKISHFTTPEMDIATYTIRVNLQKKQYGGVHFDYTALHLKQKLTPPE